MNSKQVNHPRIETSLGPIAPEHLATAVGIKQGDPIDEIARNAGLDASTIYGHRAFWRGLLKYEPNTRQTLCERIKEAVKEHGLDKISLPANGPNLGPVQGKPNRR